MFYDRFCELCQKRGIAPTRAALEIGLSKSTPTTWKQKGTTPQAAQLQRIADYFGVSTDYLLEKENDPATNGGVTDDDIKFALFEGAPVTDAQYEEVKRFARYVRDRDIHSK